MRYSGQAFNGQRIVADGNQYERCSFKDCDIVHQGGTSPSFSNCSFDNPRFSFDGPAANTVMFIRALASDPGMDPVVQDLLPEMFQRRR